MAHWRHSDRTLCAKLVYYGPALGGKTTNLQALHRITDPRGTHGLLAVNTADDRTLFFDLLPLDLGTILGYKVALKIYTVPGQVRYEATRRIVLSGADGVVFVADSRRDREADNRASLENLHVNLRANGLRPDRVPIVFQFNKQDLTDAAPRDEVAAWLGLESQAGFPAVATENRGVLEVFVSAVRATLGRLVTLADDHTRQSLQSEDLDLQVERAFAPYRARLAAGAAPRTPAPVDLPISVSGDDFLEQSVESNVRLGTELALERSRVRRLEREAEALRHICDVAREVGASFDPEVIVDSALEALGQVLGAAAVTLIREDSAETVVLERARGCAQDPLLGSSKGRGLVRKFFKSGTSCVVADLAREPDLDLRLQAVAVAPVQGAPPRLLLAYTSAADGAFHEQDIRFMNTVAGHLAAGLEKAALHSTLEGERSRLEVTVQARTRALRRAYDDLRRMDRTKDRFLSSLSHEMKTPLTAMVSAATFLRDYDGDADARGEMADAILTSSHVLNRMIDDLLRVARLEAEPEGLRVTLTTVGDVAREAIGLAGDPDVNVRIADNVVAVRVDSSKLARALSNLLENAVKFSPTGSSVEMTVRPARLNRGGEVLPAVAFSVLDRGAGVPPADRGRVFEPFEQGGELLTGKPAGAGLGLHEARGIARAHDGVLRYRERPGGGSEFRIVVPVERARSVEEVARAG